MCKCICRKKIVILKHSSIWGRRAAQEAISASEIRPSDKEKQSWMLFLRIICWNMLPKE